jgi:hypothetical protein
MEFIQLSRFEQIDFSSMNHQLFYKERRDTKFAFPIQEFNAILASLENQYVLLVHNDKACVGYSTLYYDTDNLQSYMAHHNGRGNRKKLRVRTYQDGNSFYEIKTKTNTGLTVKERNTEVSSAFDDLTPQLKVNYNRITLYDKAFQEKLTFDFNLSFSKGESQLNLQSVVIGESKKMKGSSSFFVETMKKKRIKKTSYSKYCFGMALLCKEIKKNNFKMTIKKIQQLNNGYEIDTNH